MSKTNKPLVYPKIVTHEGAPAVRINAENQLRRSVLSCMLWENEFYEDGVSIAQRIAKGVSECSAEVVANLAIEARERFKLRHVPLWIIRAMVMNDHTRPWVADTLERVIQRPDELSEFLALYWKDGRTPLANQVKKGLARAFRKFDAYSLAKYNRDGAIKLRDVMFMVHPKPENQSQTDVWKHLVDGTMEAPDTWEVALSSGANKKEAWERLMLENKLGGLALLRNLRNMESENVDRKLIKTALENMRVDRILPFRFIAAAMAAPDLEPYLEGPMLKCLKDRPKIGGGTVILVDVSGSMKAKISDKSDLTRMDAACGLAILARELCEEVFVFTFSNHLVPVPPRRGFALRDAVVGSQHHGNTYLGDAVHMINNKVTYDRIIVITDEQTQDVIQPPTALGYLINVGSYKNGVGYGAWKHIDGWSESVFDFIQASEGIDIFSG